MRVLFAVALVALGIAGVNAAGAADLVRGYASGGRHAGLLWIYDYQPGIVVRAYWATPWRHRHYYPTTGEKPESGRREDLTGGAGDAPKPAETFERSWSASSVFLPELPGDLDTPAPPIQRPSQNPAPLK